MYACYKRIHIHVHIYLYIICIYSTYKNIDIILYHKYIYTPGLIITFHQSVFPKITMIPVLNSEKKNQVLKVLRLCKIWTIWLSLNKASKWVFVGIRRQAWSIRLKPNQSTWPTNYILCIYIIYLFSFFRNVHKQQSVCQLISLLEGCFLLQNSVPVAASLPCNLMASQLKKSESTFEWSWNLGCPRKLVNG